MAKDHSLLSKSSLVALREAFRLALDALRSHKLRSYLTLLGIVLAVTTLVAVMSVVNGLNLYVADRIANLGANVFIVDRIGIITNVNAFAAAQRRPPITEEDYKALLGGTLQLSGEVGAVEQAFDDIRSGNELAENANIWGVTPNYGEIRKINLDYGRFVTEADDLHRQSVCVLGYEVAEKLFPNVDAIGKEVRAGNQSYLVIGVATKMGTVIGQSQDNFMIIPFSTFREGWHKPNGSISLFVQARSPELMEAAQDEVRVILRTRHHLSYNADDDFGTLGSASILSLWERITGQIFALAVSLTSIFLVVGGIVIMNIMLASVTERTHEIGIRKAVGARRGHILVQFLAESATLSALGGVIGVVLAAALAAVVRATTPMPVETSMTAIVVSLAISTGVGLFFGIYPAWRASKLAPIEALRAES
jgi:putative ABC transport system permease protein